MRLASCMLLPWPALIPGARFPLVRLLALSDLHTITTTPFVLCCSHLHANDVASSRTRNDGMQQRRLVLHSLRWGCDAPDGGLLLRVCCLQRVPRAAC